MNIKCIVRFICVYSKYERKGKKMLRIHNQEWYIDKIMNDNENIE